MSDNLPFRMPHQLSGPVEFAVLKVGDNYIHLFGDVHLYSGQQKHKCKPCRFPKCTTAQGYIREICGMTSGCKLYVEEPTLDPFIKCKIPGSSWIPPPTDEMSKILRGVSGLTTIQVKSVEIRFMPCLQHFFHISCVFKDALAQLFNKSSQTRKRALNVLEKSIPDIQKFCKLWFCEDNLEQLIYSFVFDSNSYQVARRYADQDPVFRSKVGFPVETHTCSIENTTS